METYSFLLPLPPLASFCVSASPRRAHSPVGFAKIALGPVRDSNGAGARDSEGLGPGPPVILLAFN